MFLLKAYCSKFLSKISRDVEWSFQENEESHKLYKKSKILNKDNLLAVHQGFKIAEIQHTDFAEVVDHAHELTFIYYDPPYRPISETANFNDCIDILYRYAKDKRQKLSWDWVSEFGNVLIIMRSAILRLRVGSVGGILICIPQTKLQELGGVG